MNAEFPLPEPSDTELTADEVDDDGSDVLDNVANEFLERQLGGGEPEISTGILALDRAIIGLRPKKMIVVAARPGMGKTAFAASIRRSVIEQGLVVLDFNLEMGKEELAERELSFRSDVNLRKVMAAREVSDEEVSRIANTRGILPKGFWWVYDTCFTLTDILRKARGAKKRSKKDGKKIGLVIIDYLQLLGDVGTEGRQQSVAACSRAAKILSKELDCCVIALSQLNRNCEYRDDKRPLMSDIRESGAIEQDADIIIFLYRDHVYNPGANPNEAELIIRKNRAGPIGPVKARFNPRTVNWDDLPPPVVTHQGVQ